jgi:hypothetical protein
MGARLGAAERLQRFPSAEGFPSPYHRFKGPFVVEVTPSYVAKYVSITESVDDFVSRPKFMCTGGVFHGGEIGLRVLDAPSDLAAMKGFGYKCSNVGAGSLAVASQTYELIENEESWGSWGLNSESVVRTRAEYNRKCSQLRAKVVSNTK